MPRGHAGLQRAGRQRGRGQFQRRRQIFDNDIAGNKTANIIVSSVFHRLQGRQGGQRIRPVPDASTSTATACPAAAIRRMDST